MFRWLAVWALRVSALFALCAPGATSAWAQPADLTEAAAAYRAGEKAMAAGRYEDAARSYGAAYEISKDPVLFFKLGSALDKGGKCPAAVTYYQRYLREAKPSESFEKLAQSRIAGCEARIAREAGAPASPTAPTSPTTTAPSPAGGPPASGLPTAEAPASPAAPTNAPTDAPATDATTNAPATDATTDTPATEPEAQPQAAPAETFEGPSARRTGAWFGVATSLALVTVGSVFALSIESTEDDLRDLYVIRAGGRPLVYDGAGRDRYDDLVERGEQYRTLAWVSFGLAGAAALTSTVLFLTSDGESSRPRAAVAPLLHEHGAGLTAALRF